MIMLNIRPRRAKSPATPPSPLEELAEAPVDVAEEAAAAAGRTAADGSSAPARSTPVSGSWDELAGRIPKRLRRSKPLDLLGWYEIQQRKRDALLTSTHQAPAVTPALMRTHEPFAGPPLGIDVSTGQYWASDPFTLYALGVITSINVAVVGDVGVAKSTLVKVHYCLDQLAAGRQVVVFDRKKNADEDEDHQPQSEEQGETELAGGGVRVRTDDSEYRRTELFARASGKRVARILFAREGKARVNVMDPRIVSRGHDSLVGQDTLLTMIVNVQLQSGGEPEMTVEESGMLAIGLRRAHEMATAEGRVADIRDLAAALFDPHSDDLPAGGSRFYDEQTMFGRGRRVAWAVQKAITGELSGLIDGPTADENGRPLDLDADLLIIDTSSLADGSTALAMVMAVMTTFLSSVWERQNRQAIAIVEEGYSADLPAVAKIFRSRAKRGRAVGLAICSVWHHYSDVAPDSPLASLYREAGITHIFRQAGAQEAQHAASVVGSPELADLMTVLERGEHILYEGIRAVRPARRIVNVLTDAERWVTWTEGATSGELGPAMPDSIRAWLNAHPDEFTDIQTTAG